MQAHCGTACKGTEGGRLREGKGLASPPGEQTPVFDAGPPLNPPELRDRGMVPGFQSLSNGDSCGLGLWRLVNESKLLGWRALSHHRVSTLRCTVRVLAVMSLPWLGQGVGEGRTHVTTLGPGPSLSLYQCPAIRDGHRLLLGQQKATPPLLRPSGFC